MSSQQLQQLAQVQLAAVIDGDTVRLAGGERVRLIGIDTPELGDEQPLAYAARDYLRVLLGHGPLYLQYGQHRRDNYQRSLAHLFLPDGRNVESELLRQGLGFPVAIPPNLDWLDCQLRAAGHARQQSLGVWRQVIKSSQHLTVADSGFGRISARLLDISEAGGSWWLQMDGLLVLRVRGEYQPWFDRRQLEAMKGRQLLVSGWLYPREVTKNKQFSPYVLLLTHPAHIEVLH